MMADFFEFTVTEIGLQEDVDKALSDIDSAIAPALGDVGNGMIENLQRHIQEDWYEPWGPPKIYQRRTDNPSLGTPLGSPANMDVSVSGRSLTFSYDPTGEHENPDWSTVNGDVLIRIIQEDDGWKYPPSVDQKGRMIFPRPFWDNFVREQEAHGIMDRFTAAMRNAKDPFVVVPEGGAMDVFGMDESLLSPQIAPF